MIIGMKYQKNNRTMNKILMHLVIFCIGYILGSLYYKYKNTIDKVLDKIYDRIFKF